MTITLTGSQTDYVEQLQLLIERIKSMTVSEFMMMANEITQPLKTPLK